MNFTRPLDKNKKYLADYYGGVRYGFTYESKNIYLLPGCDLGVKEEVYKNTMYDLSVYEDDCGEILDIVDVLETNVDKEEEDYLY